jgi:LytS/YehU family sensor histidine kinase
MLNNANVLIKRNPEEASKVLFKLEDLLRYQINDSSRERVSLASDIRFLNDYLNLEKIRRDNFSLRWRNMERQIPFGFSVIVYSFCGECGKA